MWTSLDYEADDDTYYLLFWCIFKIDPETANSYSPFIVGITAYLIKSLQNGKSQNKIGSIILQSAFSILIIREVIFPK
jgi:hypothetical protein